MSGTTTVEIDEVVIPATIDAPDAADFIRAIEVGNAVEAIGYGTDELAYEPAEELPGYRDPHEPQRVLVARLGGDIVARAVYFTQVGEGADAGWINVEVLPEFRGRGIGTMLAEAAEMLAIADGKAKALAYTPIQDGPGERIPSPTGFGSVPASDRDARFLLARGYRLEQVERASRVPLPIDALDERVASAQTASGREYAVHTWVGRTPEHWIEDIAVLATRMSTDAPSAGLEEPEDVYTAERIRTREDLVMTSPRTRIVAAVEHVPSGHLAGFTVLSAPAQLHRAVAQYATLVLREHRGHKLGMLLKVANLEHLARVKPGHPSVTTFNAEENRHMLDVNEAVGFVPFAYESAWRKDLR